MKFIFHTDYTESEMKFIERNGCEILSDIKLSKAAFKETPQRMIKYCGSYVAEIEDEGRLCWAVLEKSRKGEYIFSGGYPNLQSMADGL